MLKELEDFANISGLKINFEKTQLVWIGSKKFDTSSVKLNGNFCEASKH